MDEGCCCARSEGVSCVGKQHFGKSSTRLFVVGYFCLHRILLFFSLWEVALLPAVHGSTSSCLACALSASAGGGSELSLNRRHGVPVRTIFLLKKKSAKRQPLSVSFGVRAHTSTLTPACCVVTVPGGACILQLEGRVQFYAVRAILLVF